METIGIVYGVACCIVARDQIPRSAVYRDNLEDRPVIDYHCHMNDRMVTGVIGQGIGGLGAIQLCLVRSAVMMSN